MHGLGVGTDAAWDYATHFGLPKLIVVDALDKPNTDFEAVLAGAREHFGRTVFPMTIPLDAGPGFSRVLDVLRASVFTYKPGGNGDYKEETAEGQLAERVHDLHRELMEYVAESDDALMEKFFAEGALGEEEIRAGLHQAVQNQVFIPLFAVSAENNVGVARLMDFIAKFGPSPETGPKCPPAMGADFRHGGLVASDPVARLQDDERTGGWRTVPVSDLRGKGPLGRRPPELGPALERAAGPAVHPERPGARRDRKPRRRRSGGRRQTARDHTGDTLCSPRNVVELPKIEYPNPNIHGALRLRSKGDEDKLAVG